MPEPSETEALRLEIAAIRLELKVIHKELERQRKERIESTNQILQTLVPVR